MTLPQRLDASDADQTASPSAADYDWANTLVTDEELKKAADEPGGCSTDELLQELQEV